MPRSPNFRQSLQVRVGARYVSDVDSRKRGTVDKDAVLVLVGEDVPADRVEFLLRLAMDKAKGAG